MPQNYVPKPLNPITEAEPSTLNLEPFFCTKAAFFGQVLQGELVFCKDSCAPAEGANLNPT